MLVGNQRRTVLVRPIILPRNGYNVRMDALTFLNRPSSKLGPLYVLPGDEAFLKRLVIQALRQRALGDEIDDAAVSTYAGESASYADVCDELETVPFFSPKRLVIVEGGDPFVTKYRSQLEAKVNHLP